MRALKVWWEPEIECYRIEDGKVHTYFHLDAIIGHLRYVGAAALIAPPPHDAKTAGIVKALQEFNIPIAYSEV